ncbi:MAG: hypothetical protein CME30_01570 [Gemmatimonadetes bacterium]|nr:hypothetical protein [Gemmatimonadota bacterium]
MDLQLAIVCDEARQMEHGRLNIKGIFNDLSAPGFPAKHDMVLVIVIQWSHKDAGRYDFQVDLIGPGEKPSMTVRGHSDVANRDLIRPPPRTQIILPLEEVIFPEKGVYNFHIRVKGRSLEGPSLYLIDSTDQKPSPSSLPEKKL